MRAVFQALAVAAIVGLMAASPSNVSAADLGGGPKYTSYKDDPAMPYPRIFTWTGFYVGAHAGLATGNTQGRPDFDCGGDAGCLAFEDFLSTDFDMNGALYGGHVGYNWQSGNFVIGIEGTFSGTNVQGDGGFGITGLAERELNWLATVTGRLGYAFQRSMVYAKGGVAWGEFDTTASSLILGGDLGAGSFRATGWVAGLGFEHAISNHVLFRIEYTHIDFGSDGYDLDNIGGLPVDVDAEIDTLKVGVSYKF